MAQIAGTGSVDFTAIGNILIEVLILYLVSALLSYGQGWIMSSVAMNITYRFRKDIAEKINRMPLKYFDGTSHGEVLSRVTNDVDTVSQTLNQSLTQIITSVVTVIGVLVMMFTISWLMTLVAIVMLPISFGIIGLDREQVTGLLQTPAGLPWAYQRSRRRNVRRTCGDEGLQRRGQERRTI